MSSLADSREGLTLPRRWWRREFVPFDDIDRLDAGAATLSSGDTVRLPQAQRDLAERALAPPAPTADRAADAAAWTAYIDGSWSPRRAVDALLAMASAAGATDVHLEPDGQGFGVRFRRSGALQDFARLSEPSGRRLLAALKHRAGCLPYRFDVVQEGRVPRDGVAADIRASFLPTAFGERAALRLFGRLRTLEDLGLPPEDLASLSSMLDAPDGLVLVAGPSGGGKTTTVYAALAHIAATRDGAHLSIEDPVEQRLRLAGIPVDQVELCPERGLTAEAALSGALRQDVDVIGLAEIRSEAEAALALRAAHTGRLVVAGIHCGSAEEARQRMLDLGAEGAVLDASLRGVLHQRLVPGPCPDPASSCPECAGAGVRRRPVVHLWQPEAACAD